jgi:hypothetical protein
VHVTFTDTDDVLLDGFDTRFFNVGDFVGSKNLCRKHANILAADHATFEASTHGWLEPLCQGNVFQALTVSDERTGQHLLYMELVSFSTCAPCDVRWQYSLCRDAEWRESSSEPSFIEIDIVDDGTGYPEYCRLC